MLFVDWWMGLEQVQQVFWSIAIVSSILFFILVLVSLFGEEAEGEVKAGNGGSRIRLTEPKSVLVAFMLFGWASVSLSYWLVNLNLVLLLSSIAGVVGALLPWFFSPLLSRPKFDVEAVRKSTGEVLTSIPPHRNGFGKVHLNLRALPFEMDAVTAGDELPAGVPVRVIEVIDDRVLLVEALDDLDEGQSREKESGSDEERAGPGPGGNSPSLRRWR